MKTRVSAWALILLVGELSGTAWSARAASSPDDEDFAASVKKSAHAMKEDFKTVGKKVGQGFKEGARDIGHGFRDGFRELERGKSEKSGKSRKPGK